MYGNISFLNERSKQNLLLCEYLVILKEIHIFTYIFTDTC